MVEELKVSELEPRKHAWSVLVTLLIVCIVAMMAQFKPTPVQVELMVDLGMGLESVGLLSSAFALGGMVLALISGKFIQKIGLKNTLLMGVVLLAVGSLFGCFVSTSTLMLVARFIEGFGGGLVLVVTPTAIALFFPGKHQGLAMGLWSADIPLGVIAMMFVGPALDAVFGWAGLWWLTVALDVLCFILVLVVFKNPEVPAEMNKQEIDKDARLTDALKQPVMWCLVLIYFCFNTIISSALAVMYPTYLNLMYGVDMATGSALGSFSMYAVLVAGPVAGFLVDKFGAGKVLFVSLVGAAILMAFPYQIHETWAVIAVLLLIGVFSGCAPTSLFASVVPALGYRPELASTGMSMLIVARNVGMVLGPTFMGAVAAAFGWSTGGWICFAVMVVCACLGIPVIRLLSKQKAPVSVDAEALRGNE